MIPTGMMVTELPAEIRNLRPTTKRKGTRETSRQTGKTQDFRVDKSSVLIEEIVISVTRYPWWVVLDDSDYITNKIKGHLKHDNFKALAEFEKEVIGHYDATKFKTLLSKAKESKE
jgi:hypothetical protein